jgi:hypothetical protein
MASKKLMTPCINLIQPCPAHGYKEETIRKMTENPNRWGTTSPDTEKKTVQEVTIEYLDRQMLDCLFPKGSSKPTPQPVEEDTEDNEFLSKRVIKVYTDTLKRSAEGWRKEGRTKTLEEVRGVVPAIKRLISHADTSPRILNAVYIEPAQQLRNAADALEQQKKDYAAVKAFLDTLSSKSE